MRGVWRVLGVAAVAVATLAVVAAIVAGGVLLTWPGDDGGGTARRTPSSSPSVAEAACNGHVELCDRRFDQVAYPATHNSMAAAAERGWFFPEQPDGIVAQLDHGVRVLLIDSWYGQSTDRHGVIATSGSERDLAIQQARAEHGSKAVETALRVRGALGLEPTGSKRPYLCHALCELGSTPWLRSLRDLRGWLDDHPREVVTLFVQDEVSPADTAAVFEKAGLLPDVYTPSGPSWPTLGEMIDSGHRLVVMQEFHGGRTAYPWLLQGFDLVQDTPYLFKSPADFSCAPNRGPADASLFLVNHWIDTNRNVTATAADVNARDVLLPRLRQCQAERGHLPNFVAVDFYDRGDLMSVVDELNGVKTE